MSFGNVLCDFCDEPTPFDRVRMCQCCGLDLCGHCHGKGAGKCPECADGACDKCAPVYPDATLSDEASERLVDSLRSIASADVDWQRELMRQAGRKVR